MADLPPPVAEPVSMLAAMPGTVAVVLGGSHALGAADVASDWDLGLMNGGAWLRSGPERVDAILRDLDVVEHWTRRAEEGEFETDLLLGYLAGMPTYTLTAELASCRVLHGRLPAAPYPTKLAAAGPPSWRFRRSFSLDYARTARLASLLDVFREIPSERSGLTSWVDDVAAGLGVPTDEVRPWNPPIEDERRP